MTAMTWTDREEARAHADHGAVQHGRAHLRICLPRRSPQWAAAEIVEVLRQHRREG